MEARVAKRKLYESEKRQAVPSRGMWQQQEANRRHTQTQRYMQQANMTIQ